MYVCEGKFHEFCRLDVFVKYFTDLHMKALKQSIFGCVCWRGSILLRATSHTRLRARDCLLQFKHSHWWKRRSRSKFATSHHARLRDERSIYIYKWMQDGGECKVYKDSYMASNGSCRMVTWTISKTHLLEVGSTQNRDTMALQTLTSVDVFYFYHVWEPTWIEIRWNGICLRARSYMASHYTWGSVTTLHDFGGVCWDGLWALSFGLLQFSQSRLFGPCVKWPLVMPRSTQQAARICTEGPCGLINNYHPSQHMVPQTGRK